MERLVARIFNALTDLKGVPRQALHHAGLRPLEPQSYIALPYDLTGLREAHADRETRWVGNAHIGSIAPRFHLAARRYVSGEVGEVADIAAAQSLPSRGRLFVKYAENPAMMLAALAEAARKVCYRA